MARLQAMLVEAPFRSLQPLRTALHALGVSTVTARSHKDALAVANQRKLDGAFVDGGFIRPSFNTVQALRHTRSNGTIPLTVIADRASGADDLALAHGANQVLIRPCTTEQLWDRLRAVHDAMDVERRRYQRLGLSVPVFCVWGDERRHYGHSVNISPSGMLLSLWPQPTVGSVVTLAFGLSGLDQEFIVRGAVVRADGKGRLGVRYQWHSDTRARELLEKLTVRGG